MVMCADLSDISDPDVGALVPQWLQLVSERLAAPGARLRPSGHVLNILLADKLLLTVFSTGGGPWELRVQSMVTFAELGLAGRPFSVLGVVALDCGAGCGDPSRLAGRVRDLLEVPELLLAVQPCSDRRLLDAWCALEGLPTAR